MSVEKYLNDLSVLGDPGHERVYALLINAFEKLPGENFRDQRYTFLYEILKRRVKVTWLSSDFHHWSHSRRCARMIPAEDRDNIQLVRTLSYSGNISIRRLISYLGLSVATLWNILRLKGRPDVIVCMGPVEQMFLVVVYGRIRRIPVLIDVIDPWPDVYVQAFPRLLRWFGRLLLSPYFLLSVLTFKLCDRVTAVSETYLAWARRRGKREDSHAFSVYYLGARNDHFNVSAVSDSQSTLSCLFAGQFGFSYDIDLILDAAQKLHNSGEKDIRFVVCGAGENQAAVSDRVALLPNVELHGWLNPAELNAVGARCQVGLCCYRSSATQSLPTKLFDYLSMGLYVVSSLTGEAEALLSGHGVGCNYPSSDVTGFIECLVKVRQDVNLGVVGRTEIRQVFDRNFSSDVIYDRMVDEAILPLAAIEPVI